MVCLFVVVFCQLIQSFNVLLETQFIFNYYNMFLLKIKRLLVFKFGGSVANVFCHFSQFWRLTTIWFVVQSSVPCYHFFQIFIKQFMPEKGIIVKIIFHFVTWFTECDLWQW